MVFSRDIPHSFEDALRVCREILSANRQLIQSGTIEAEAEQLVMGAHRIAKQERLSRAEFFLRLKDRLPEASGEKLLVLALQRAEGIPLQHLLGWQEFGEHEYEVNASTLIPRPETEVLLVEAVRELRSPVLGIEIGVGSGILSIELLARFPELRMLGSEVSEGAIELATKNARRIIGTAERLQIRRVLEPGEVLESMAAALGGAKADFLISNPPYLDLRAPEETTDEVRANEPRAALFPESGDPLHFYRRIALGAGELLKPDGKVFLEIAAERAHATEALFAQNWKTRMVDDLAGRPRVLVAERKA